MLIPYSTDAPIYHWPIVTVGLIVINVVVYALSASGAETPDGLPTVLACCLVMGDGVHPHQWITANFLHADPVHLIGNMVFLWTFGLIVEGKIGGRWFLAIYLFIGTLTMMLIQLVSLGASAGFALGASGAIYGLIGMALVWAPENDVLCLLFTFWFPPVRLRVSVLAGIYFTLEILGLCFIGRKVSSELIHMLGAGIGFGVGVLMLRQGWVDCEHWDLFSVWRGRNKMTEKERWLAEQKERAARELEAPPDPQTLEKQRRAALAQLADLVDAGDFKLAALAHARMTRTYADWCLPEPVFYRMVAGVFKQPEGLDPVPLAVDYLRTYGERAVPVRLILAAALLRERCRPAQARRVLARLPASGLTPKEETYRLLLDQEAAAHIREGTLEEATEEW